MSAAVLKLNCGKAAGPDRLMVEHLKAGGKIVVIWLLNVLNTIVELEVIPDVLKRSIYKGRQLSRSDVVIDDGESFGVSLSPEAEVVFLEADLPHVNQTAYRRSVSCANAIFTTQEVIAKYLNSGSKVYMCLYDLQKAFDSVEYAVLMDKLFEVGVNGKMWRLLRNWYEGGSCCMCNK